MKLEEKHLLEKNAIALEEAAESAERRTYGTLNAGWGRKTVSALRRAAKLLRNRIAEETVR